MEDGIMDLDRIKEIIKVVEESNINEITVEEDGVRITIRKGITGEQTKADAKETTIEGHPSSTEEIYPDNWKSIVAPMVGTFYRSPAPDAPLFVEEGDLVEEGQTVCILEAMKLMNEITAEEKGIIKKVLVENGYSVEYGQNLFLYEPIK
jgi:oxaloacetate decarboxylase alpha subunit